MDGFGRESPPSGKADAESALLHPLTDVLSVSDDVGASCFDSDFGDPHQQHGHDPRAAERGGGGGGVVPNPADGAVEFRRQRAFGRAAPCSGGRSPDRAHGSDVGSVKSLRHHPAEGDVCYSPYTRRTLDSAVDHDALSEYLATGDVDAAHRKSPAAAVTQRRVTRRDSKGFTFGKPQLGGTERFMFYAKSCGVLRANTFGKLCPEERPDADHTPNGRQDGRRLRKSVSDIIKAGGFWLDVTSPTADEMKAFSKIFGIHPLTVEDIQMQEDREKCEMFPSYYFVCFRTFNQDQHNPNFMQPIVYYMVVLQEGALSFHFTATPHAHNVLARIDHLRDYISVSPDWICYALIDDIADSFGPLIQQLEAAVVSIDELVLILNESEQSDMLQRIGHARRNVMGLLRLLTTKPDVVKVLSKRLVQSSEIALYYGDIQDHLLGMLSSLNYYEGVLGRSHSNYLAQISIEITQSSNQTNAVLNKITIIGSILVPMNVVTGLWGMNVYVPGGIDEGSLVWFCGIVAFLVLFSMVSVVGLRRYQAL